MTQWSSYDAVDDLFSGRLNEDEAEQFADHLNQTATEWVSRAEYEATD